MRFSIQLSLMIACLLVCGGCSLFSKDKRLLYEGLAKSVRLESTSKPLQAVEQTAAAPLFIPVSWITLATDACIVDTGRGFYEAGRMTYRWVIEPEAQEAGMPVALRYARRGFLTPPVYLISYVIYVFSPWGAEDF